MEGFSGVRPRERCARTRSSGIIFFIVAYGISSTFCTSWEVRKPSKKWTKGTRALSVAEWAISAKSMTSWTLLEARRAQPVWRAAITSWWSPKMERAWAATARAAMWKTVETASPAILYMLGIMRRRPWEAVKVVESAPAVRAPCTAPAAPASDCISVTCGTVPQRFLRPIEENSSASSPMGEEGVMG